MGPPPSASTVVKLVKQSMKMRLASPGKMPRMSGHSSSRKMWEERMPSWLARRQLDSGMPSMLCRMRRAASGMLKNTWASSMPNRPYR
ncbi:hypothetical protein D3C72_1781730 [compost metagenome]